MLAKGAECAVLVLTIMVVGPLSAQQLPAGAGADVIKARCVSCHEPDLIASSGSRPWVGTASGQDGPLGRHSLPEQRDVLQAYLAANFGPRASASHASLATTAAAGEATFKRACLGCHGTDLVEQQRLSRTGWVREVEKMMRWGATVPADEKDPLVDHLAARFGVR